MKFQRHLIPLVNMRISINQILGIKTGLEYLIRSDCRMYTPVQLVQNARGCIKRVGSYRSLSIPSIQGGFSRSTFEHWRFVMRIGTPKELFDGEARVAMTPESAVQLQKLGYELSLIHISEPTRPY